MLIGPLLDIMNMCSISIVFIIDAIQHLFDGKTFCFKSFRTRLIEPKVKFFVWTLWFLSSEQRECVCKRKQVTDCGASPSPLPQRRKKINTMDHWRSQTSNQARFNWTHHSRTWNVHCGFFFLITGNENENSNILILLYCYRTTIGSVAIGWVTLV